MPKRTNLRSRVDPRCAEKFLKTNKVADCPDALASTAMDPPVNATEHSDSRPFSLIVSPVGYVYVYMCACVLYVSGSICKVFSAVFEMVTFGRLYNVPNDVIGADADDRSKDELLLASFSSSPMSSPPPKVPHMSLHRMSSAVHTWPQQTVCCPRFDDFTVRTD